MCNLYLRADLSGSSYVPVNHSTILLVLTTIVHSNYDGSYFLRNLLSLATNFYNATRRDLALVVSR